jgi:hypothetical protein
VRLVARTAQAMVIVVLAAAGGTLIAEATGSLQEGWRNQLAEAIGSVAAPTWAPWILAPLGATLAIAAVTLAAVQLVPPKKGVRLMLPVHSFDDGSTQLSGRALLHAIRQRLHDVEGVVDVEARITRRRADIELRVDDRADLAFVDERARALLDHGFWLDLGVADLAVDLTVVHHPRPPRVR